jgi:hypothetical protein
MTGSQLSVALIAVSLVAVLVCTVVIVIAVWRSPTASLKVGAAGLVIGLLIFFAARSAGGGLAGILLGALLAWFAFEVAYLPVRGMWRARQRVMPRHATIGGCLGVLTLCGVGGLWFLFGTQLLIGAALGAGLAILNSRVRLLTLPRLIGLDIMPAPAGTAAPVQMPLTQHVWLMAVVGLVCLVAGYVFAGLGAVRTLESYAYLTDIGCVHPCGMVHGLWVQVMPDSQGNFVARLDTGAARLRVRFWNDEVGDRVASRDDFTVTNRTDFAMIGPSIYYPVTDRSGCDAWPARTLHLDEQHGDPRALLRGHGIRQCQPRQARPRVGAAGGSGPDPARQAITRWHGH